MLCPRSCFSVVWLTCLGPQGTGLERKCKLLWWFPVKSHMKSGTHSTDSCHADPGAHEFPHPSSLSCVYHFLLNQSLLIAWIIQLLVGACLPCVRQKEVVPFSQPCGEEVVPGLVWHLVLQEQSWCFRSTHAQDTCGEFKIQTTWEIQNLGLGIITLSKKWKIAGSSSVAHQRETCQTLTNFGGFF